MLGWRRRFACACAFEQSGAARRAQQPHRHTHTRTNLQAGGERGDDGVDEVGAVQVGVGGAAKLQVCVFCVVGVVLAVWCIACGVGGSARTLASPQHATNQQLPRYKCTGDAWRMIS